MGLDEIKELLRLFGESNFSKLVWKQGDAEFHLERELRAAAPRRDVEERESFSPEPSLHGPRGGSSHVEVPGTFITSPMVGTFYASPSPDKPPFVKVGDAVDGGTVVCIVEAMKVMNEVKAGMSGKVVEVLVHNGQPVEFGTRLFRIT
ncbi:MAG: acetyl-CoA carboxylase biotin carboxyl carrier protein [Verrucomicrobiota bacterium]|nr:acetyl-CoA carboxylase biotin carboxyl carrier protein [Verrucomicrobiota bacterium]